MLILPINSMVIGKSGGGGDRQTFGIGADGDSLPTLSAAHHHAVACLVGHGGGFGMKRQSIRQSGLDSYNFRLTGQVAKCISSSASDSDHIPLCVFHDVSPRRKISFECTPEKPTRRKG